MLEQCGICGTQREGSGEVQQELEQILRDKNRRTFDGRTAVARGYLCWGVPVKVDASKQMFLANSMLSRTRESLLSL